MHEHCGMATFVFVEDDKLIPITRYANIDGFMNAMSEVAELAESGKKVRAGIENDGEPKAFEASSAWAAHHRRYKRR